MKPIPKKINKRIIVLFLLFMLFEALRVSAKKGVLLIPISIINAMHIFITAILALLLTNIILRLTVSRVFELFHDELEIEQRILVSKSYTFFLYIIAFAFVLSQIGVSLQTITIFLGLMATGIAFAIRDLLMAVFAWFVIIVKTPFRIKDYIKIGEDLGEVTRVGTFFVTLDVYNDKKTIIKIPNKTFLEKSIINYGKDRIRKLIKIPLKELIPESIMIKIKKGLEDMTAFNEELVLITDLENGIPYLHIHYVCPPAEEHELHTRITYFLYKICKQYVRVVRPDGR